MADCCFFLDIIQIYHQARYHVDMFEVLFVHIFNFYMSCKLTKIFSNILNSQSTFTSEFFKSNFSIKKSFKSSN